MTCKLIPLNHGKVTQVSTHYYPLLREFNWHFHKSSGYAQTRVDGETITLQHLILPVKKPFEVDHINRNRLDNRVENLRYLTPAENRANCKNNRRNKSGQPGVFYMKRIDRWVAHVGKPRMYLGCFKHKEAAIMIYLLAAEFKWGHIAEARFEKYK